MRSYKIALLLVTFILIGTVHADFIPFSPDASPDTPVQLDVREFHKEINIRLQTQGVTVSEMDTEQGVFNILSLKNTGWTGNVGHPRMPFKGIYVEVPPGVDIQVSVSGEAEEIPGTFTVMPQQPPLLDCSEPGDKPVFEFNPSVYSSTKPMPGEIVRVAEDGFMRGHRVLFLEIFPLQYVPATGIVTAIPDLNVTLEWTGEPSQSLLMDRSRLASDAFDTMVQRLVVNPEAYSVGSAPEPHRKSGSRDGTDYLIIAADQFADELLPLVEWKTLKGYKTRLATLSEVGGTTSAAIQSYLQNAFDTWAPAPVYVLLVGDVAQMPSTTVSPDAYGASFPSDLPYSKLAGSDYFPDIFLGRFSVATEAQCTTVVSKVVGYDRTPEAADWYHNGLIAAYFQDDYSPSCEADRWFLETAMHVYEYLGGTLGMNMSTALCTSASGCSNLYYRSDGYPHRPAHPSQVPQAYVDMIVPPYQARDQITAAINDGVSIVQHRDHGGETSWGDPPYNVSQINGLENSNRLPVVFSLNCLTGAMDYGSDCFAEAFQKHDNGGAVGVVAATRVSYSGYNDLLCHGIYTGMYPNYDTSHSGNIYNNSVRPGEAMTFGKYYMSMYEGTGSSTKYTFRLFHWFGDPEMLIRTDYPVAPTVELPPAIPAGTTHVSLPVAEDYALVGISQDGVLLGRGAAFGGMAEIPLETPVQAGMDVSVVVTGYNLMPLEATVLSTAPDCGIVAFEDSVLNCDGSFEIQVMDFDLNLNPTQIDTMTATVFSDSDPTGIQVVCTETGADLGIFSGTFTTGSGGLTAAHGDTATLLYQDADCNGMPVDVTADVPVDCIGPAISNIQFTPDAEAITVTWSTDEPALSRLYYGDVNPPDQMMTGDEFMTSHSLTIPGLSQCTDYYLYVAAEDEAGNETVHDNGGAGHTVTTYQNVAVMDEPLDINPQWGVQGQWGWGVPAGQGGEHGNPDPTSGYTGSNVYGYNLNGDYPNNMNGTDYLISSAVDCSDGENVTLSFWGWVGVEKSEYDHIFIDVSSDGGATWDFLYENPYALSFDGGEWTYWEFDITPFAAGFDDVQIRWGMGPTDAGWQYCGWNIDDIQVVLTGECGSIPTPPPTPTVYPTNTPFPTNTPTPTPTIHPTTTPPPHTPTPTPTVTPPLQTGVTLEMPGTMYEAGDTFYLDARVTNGSSETLENCPLFIILDVYGALYYGPSFGPSFDHYLSMYPVFPPGETVVHALPEFQWPSGAGSADGLHVYGALTDPGMIELLGEFDMMTFGWR